METTIDFPGLFASCRTIGEANATYKQLYEQYCNRVTDGTYWAVSDAHRRTLERLSGFVLLPPKERVRTDGPRPTDVRNWARQRGLSMPPKGRPSKAITDAYRQAHLPASEALAISSTPSSADVRTWAKQQGIEVGSRGRIHPDVVRQYQDAHASPGH